MFLFNASTKIGFYHKIKEKREDRERIGDMTDMTEKIRAMETIMRNTTVQLYEFAYIYALPPTHTYFANERTIHTA